MRDVVGSIPFDRYRITLRLRAPAHFHFLHGGVLQGLLRRAFGSHEMPPGVLFFAAESGRTLFNAGDDYAFSVTFAGESRALAWRLAAALAAAGQTAAGTPPPTLGGNFDVENVQTLPTPDLERQIEAAKTTTELNLRFVSPLRLDRPEELKRRGAGFVNRDCFPPDHFLGRLWQRLFKLRFDRYPAGNDIAAMPPLDTPIDCDPRDLLWIDLPIPGVKGTKDAAPQGITLGGVLGRVVLRNVPAEWIEPLVAGQWMHTGEKTAFGLGRYVIEECGTLWDDALRPATSLLQRIADPQRLARALEHIVEQSEAPGIDRVSPDNFALRADSELPSLARRLTEGTWDPPDLLGFVAPKKDGGTRALAIPTVADRVAQRAACDLLAPAIDTLLEDCSYAYRKGFSRSGAAQAIGRAYADGFRWVLDADITSFFDAVDWNHLFGKLRALYPAEPLIPLIERWIAAAVVYEGARIERHRGLPQGSPLAPLLANLYLDELDEEILGKDYRLVRYADDFVVLCKDLDTARAAKEDVQKALERLGLSLNEAKTDIRSLDAGLTYLGYLFCRSVVIDSPPESEDEAGEPRAATPNVLSWLAEVPLHQVRVLRADGSAEKPPSEPFPLAGRDTPAAEESPLYVLRPGTHLHLHQGRIVIRVADEPETTLPIRGISHLVCFRGTHPSVPLLLELSEAKKPVFFCHHDGSIEAVLSPWDPDWTLWTAQLALANDDARRTTFVRSLVQAKLHNAATIVRRLDLGRAQETAAQLREVERECDNKSEIDSLRGLEGRGGALFFAALRESLPAEWGFTTRERNPPPDAVNAMLSFAYTILHNHAATAIIATGLNPRIGVFHEGRGTWQALASDLSEELRHDLPSPDERDHEGLGEVRMNSRLASCFRRVPLPPWMLTKSPSSALETRLLTRFTPPGGEPLSYLEFLARQASRLRMLVNGTAETYEPLRIHA